MTEPLRQNTAATIQVGPIMDITGNGVSDLSLTYADFKLKKPTGVFNCNSAVTCNHSHGGHYLVNLTTVDTGVPGGLTASLNLSPTYEMAPKECVVWPPNVYDSLVPGTDLLDVNADVADAMNAAPEGTAAVGSVQARLKTIEAKAAQIGAAEIEATGPLSDDGTVMTLRRGDEYSTALGNPAVWVDSSDSWPYIGDAAAVTLTLRSVETGAVLLSKEGTIGLVGDHQGITVELAAEDTTDLPTGIYVADFDVEVTWADKGPWTLPVEGRVIVLEDLTREEEEEPEE